MMIRGMLPKIIINGKKHQLKRFAISLKFKMKFRDTFLNSLQIYGLFKLLDLLNVKYNFV